MSIKTIPAVNAAKLTRAGCRLLGRQGSSLTGRAAMLFSRSFIGDLASQVRRKTIVVCGTNGKTTTNNLLCTALETEGYSVVCDRLLKTALERKYGSAELSPLDDRQEREANRVIVRRFLHR